VDRLAGLHGPELAVDLVPERVVDALERVQVLDLHLDAELGPALGRTLALTSQRRLPCSRLQSLTPA